MAPTPSIPEPQARQADAIRAHVFASVDAKLRQPNRMMKHPFIDPGSVYEGNLWDWDSFWSAYALLRLADTGGAEWRSRKATFIEHARGSVHNFLDWQMDDGYVPIMIQEKDYPEPYLNRRHREGIAMNVHKPFLCQQVRLVSEHSGDYEWIRERFPKLEAYLACHDRIHFHERCGLYVWVNDIMIGMDNDPATFGRPPGATAGLFLNCFMVEELRAAADIADRLGRGERASFYRQKSAALEDALRAECWDPRDGFYYSADVDVRTRAYDWFHAGLGVFWKTLPIKIRAWPGFLPLWTGTATAAQAERLARHAADPATFAAPGGIRTLSRDERMHSLQPTINPSNWLGPVWTITSYLVCRGLLRYGLRLQAQELATRTLALLADDLERTGTLHEFYDPETCAPIMNPGFLNWNMLAVAMAEEAWAT